jgi:ketosteroid isomerase-like protein
MTLEMESGESLSMIGKWFASYRKQPDGTWLLATDIWNMDAPMTAG